MVRGAKWSLRLDMGLGPLQTLLEEGHTPVAQRSSQTSSLGRRPPEKILFIFPARRTTSIPPVRGTGFFLKIWTRVLAFPISYLFWRHWPTGPQKLPCAASRVSLTLFFSLPGMPGFGKDASAGFWFMSLVCEALPDPLGGAFYHTFLCFHSTLCGFLHHESSY